MKNNQATVGAHKYPRLIAGIALALSLCATSAQASEAQDEALSLYKNLETAKNHALAIEGHVVGVPIHAWIFYGNSAI